MSDGFTVERETGERNWRTRQRERERAGGE